MSAFAPIDSTILDTITGGTASSGIDQLLGQLSSMTGSINEIKNKTNGLDQNSMFMLCLLAMRQQQSVVVVGARRAGCWW